MSDDFIPEDNGEQKKIRVSREEFERRLAEKRKNLIKKRILLAAICIAFVAVVVILIVLGTGFVSKLLKKAGAEVDIKYTAGIRDVVYGGDGDVRLFGVDDCLYAYDNGEINCHDDKGTILWSYSLLNMSEPAFASETGESGPFIAFDKNGSNVVAFSKSGRIWEKNISGNINAVYYNAKCGIGAISYDDELYKGAVLAFKVKDGSLIDLFTKNYSSRYVLSCAISDNGKSLAVSGVSAEEGVVQGIISLTSIEDSKTYYTKQTDDYVLPYVGFVKDDVLCAAGSSALVYVKNDMKIAGSETPDNAQVIKTAVGTEKLISVSAGDGLCVAAFGSGDGAGSVVVCDSSGKIINTLSFDDSISEIIHVSGGVVLCTDNSLVLLDTKGKQVGSHTGIEGISDVQHVNGMNLLVTYKDGSEFMFAIFSEQ